MQVGLKFCGQCQPKIDLPYLLKLIKKLNPSHNYFPYAQQDFELLLVMQACASECVNIPLHACPLLHVIGQNFNHIEYEQLTDLAKAVVKAICNYEQNK